LPEKVARTNQGIAALDVCAGDTADRDQRCLPVWWAPATGSANTGGDLEFKFGEHLVRFRVTEGNRPTRVRWYTVDCAVMPDWVGTTIAFDLSSSETGGTTVHFRHAGQVLKLVQTDEMAAGQIATQFDMTQQAVSLHLKTLERAGLLNERRDGTRRMYSLRPEGLDNVRHVLAVLWPDALARLKRAVDPGRNPKGKPE
jgi:DNA-binding transcriptional ArsR family regulator